MNASSPFALRNATLADIPALRDLHANSWVELGGLTYTEAQIAGLMADIVTVVPDLITGGTYYVVEHSGRLVASGGWTMRANDALDGRRSHSRETGPVRPSATIRAVFTSPDFARRGLAGRIMNHAERRALTEGEACEIRLTATLSGLPFYSSIGYRVERTISIGLSNGETALAVEMRKDTSRRPPCADAAAISSVCGRSAITCRPTSA